MKKLTALLLVTAMTLSLTACGGGTKASPYELYQTATKKLESTNQLEAITTMSMSITYEGELLDMEMDGRIKQITHDETDIDLEMIMSISSLGQSMDTTVYYTGGYYYMDFMGQQFKMSLPVEEILEQANTDAFAFEESAVKNQNATTKDGGTELSFTLDGSALSTLLEEQMATLTQTFGSNASYSYGDVSLTGLLDKNGDLKSSKVDFSFDMTIEGETLPVSATIYLEYVATENVVIDFPTDLEGYMEVDPSLLGM